MKYYFIVPLQMMREASGASGVSGAQGANDTLVAKATAKAVSTKGN